MANLNKSPLIGGSRTKNAENVSDSAKRKNNSNKAVVTKMFGAVFALCLIGMSAWNVTLNPLHKSGQSDINLASIEAMAAGNESSETGSESGNGSESGSESGVGGGVEQCDIYLYNRNFAEDYIIAQAVYSTSMGIYILIEDLPPLGIGVQYQNTVTVRAPKCVVSIGNCCRKSYAQGSAQPLL